MNVYELIEEQARIRPSAPAVTSGGTTLTYARLNARANQLAHHLRGLGAGPDKPVGLFLERGAELLVGMLGILKAGSPYVPLDPEYPLERLAYILHDTAASHVVTLGRLADRLPEKAGVPVCLDSADEAIASCSETDLERSAAPEDLAYIIYTSGSTGAPKGVMITHAGFGRRMREIRRLYELTADDVVLQSMSINFDASVIEIFPTLLAGARLVVGDHDWDPARILTSMAEHQVTLGMLPGSVWHRLTSHLAESGRLPDGFRRLVLGGERVNPASVRNWFQVTSTPLLNLYGPTEITVAATGTLITGPLDRVPIGKPLSGTEVFVMDRLGGLVPMGLPGELWIGGSGLARGYVNLPGLTAEKFVERTIGGRTRRLYRSGDLVRWLPNGELDFQGRIDDQVKIRGIRIEPGEVTARLMAHPGMVSCVVTAREDESGDKRLVAYCQTAEGAELGGTAVRQWCARFLPLHMVPHDFVFLAAMPLTPSGKVDVKALPDPDPGQQEARAYVAPRNTAEKEIVALFREVLGIERAGALDDFFALGGDSFRSIQLASKAKERGIRLNPRVIFQHPTVEEMARNALFPAVLRADDAAAAPGGAPAGHEVRGNRPAMRFEVIGGQEPGDDRPVSVVHLGGSTAERIVFCLHEVSGTVSHYADLAAELAPVARVIGIESRTVAFGTPPDTDVSVMAADYWRAMQELQPTGPYVIVGYSLGGMLGLEVARLAEEAGRTVGRLVVIDGCLAVQGPRAMLEEDLRVLTAALRILDGTGASADLSADASLTALLKAINLPEELLLLPHDEVSTKVRIMDAHTRAALSYAPRRTQIDALLFQAANSPWRTPLKDCWASYVRSLDVRMAAGGHHTVTRQPHIRDIAAAVTQTLSVEHR